MSVSHHGGGHHFNNHSSKEHGSGNGSPHEEIENGQRYPPPLGDSGQLPPMLQGMPKDPSLFAYPSSVASSLPFSIKSLIPTESRDVNKYDLMQQYGYFGALSNNPHVQESFYNPIYHHLPTGNAS